MFDQNTIDAQLLDLMLRAGSRWVLWLLLALSVAAVAIIFERIWFFMQERTPRAHLDLALSTLRDNGARAATAKLAGLRSMEAAVARACLGHAGDGAASVEEHKAAVLERERVRFERRLAFLGTLGNNAPFIGLFGTVLGIIRAFHDLAGNSVQGTQAVMSGIAEALVATGVGLLVALPAVATYNAFIRRVETTTAGAEAIAHQILAHIKASPAKEA
ncbi:MAG TPA: MotA/TolQ/ExbB proton channel family protein [Kofleriaceae bacterium]